MSDHEKAKTRVANVLGPDVEPHTDSSRIIGRLTTYHGDEHRYLCGHQVMIVAVMKDALRAGEHRLLTTDDEVRRAGGVGPDDRVEVAPILPEKGRPSFATSDPRAVDLGCFRGLAGSHHQKSTKQGVSS